MTSNVFTNISLQALCYLPNTMNLIEKSDKLKICRFFNKFITGICPTLCCLKKRPATHK